MRLQSAWLFSVLLLPGIPWAAAPYGAPQQAMLWEERGPREDDSGRVSMERPEVELKASPTFTLHNSMEVTIIVTNLSVEPLVLNRRLLINHASLEGEVFFDVEDINGKRLPFRRLVTPIEPADEEFVKVPRGYTIQRTIDLADYFEINRRGPYKVKATYRNTYHHYKYNQPAWMGMVSSTPVQIEVR